MEPLNEKRFYERGQYAVTADGAENKLVLGKDTAEICVEL